MILYSRVTTLPQSEPVSLSEAKAHLKEDLSDNDTLIDRLITTARRMCEAYTGLSFVTQERVIKMDYFPICDRFKGNEIIVPYGPVQSIDGFTYIDSDGDEQALTENTHFKVDKHSEICRLYPISDNAVSSWPSNAANLPHAIEIEYTAGYDDVSYNPLPEEVKQAMLLQIGAMYQNRQDEVVGTTSTISTELNWNSKAILDNIKVTWNASY